MIFNTRTIETSIANWSINDENRFELKKSFRIKKFIFCKNLTKSIYWNLRRKQNKKVSSKTKFENVVICFFEFDYERSRVYWKKWRHEEDFWFSIFNVWKMIVCDDRFLNDESMLKNMLRIFKKRIIRTFHLRSISWVVLFLSFRRETRDVCVCVCVLCSKEMRIKSVVCEKNLSSVEFKDFYLLKSILELIVRSLVNIKREKRSLLRWRNSNIFYSILSFKHFFIQFYLNFNCYFFFLKFFEIYVLCFIVLFRQMIVFNFFSFESYYVYESTLIIKTCKKMIKIARYMIQRKFANYMILKQSMMNERLK
jgi:hypothetical protein